MLAQGSWLGRVWDLDPVKCEKLYCSYGRESRYGYVAVFRHPFLHAHVAPSCFTHVSRAHFEVLFQEGLVMRRGGGGGKEKNGFVTKACLGPVTYPGLLSRSRI